MFYSLGEIILQSWRNYTELTKEKVYKSSDLLTEHSKIKKRDDI